MVQAKIIPKLVALETCPLQETFNFCLLINIDLHNDAFASCQLVNL